MTQRETERLTRVEENQKSTNDKLDYLIDRFDKYVEAEAKKDDANSSLFITRLEAKAYAAAVTIIITLATTWLYVKDHLK